MMSSGMSGGMGRDGWSLHKRPGTLALLIAGSVLGGIYLGSSTVAEINPFYTQPRIDGSSYTSNGWRGADAVSPPPYQQRPYQAPQSNVSRFMSGVYAWAPDSVRDFAAEMAHARDIAADVAAMGRTVTDAVVGFPADPEAPILDEPRESAADGYPIKQVTVDDAREACESGAGPCGTDRPDSWGGEEPYPSDDYPADDGPEI